MALFPDISNAPEYRPEASRELRRVSRQLEYERWRARELRRQAGGRRDLELKAGAAERETAKIQLMELATVRFE